MKKYLLILTLFLLIPSISFGADSKVTALTEDTTPTSDDLVKTVNAPGSSPADRKATLGNLVKWFFVPGGSTNVTTITGNYTFGITLTGNTALTFPQSGTLLTDANISDTAYGVAWGDITSYAPSKNAVYDKIESVISGYPTQASLHVDDVLTALGIASEATHFGAFTGSTIADNQTAKAAMQALETAVELRPLSSALATDNSTASNIIAKDSAGEIENLTLSSSLSFSGTTTPKLSVIAPTPVIDDPDNFAANFTTDNLYGGTFIASAAGTAALPAVAAGMNFTIVLEGANAVILNPDSGGTADTIVMNGLAAAADENITSSTSGAMCIFQYRAANSWMATCNGFVEATPP